MTMITTDKFSRPYGHLKSHVKVVCCVTCTSEVYALDREAWIIIIIKEKSFWLVSISCGCSGRSRLWSIF